MKFFFLAIVPAIALALFLLTTNNHHDALFISRATTSLQNEDDVDACITSVDCAMNGECAKRNPKDAQSPGRCLCFDGWMGRTCEVLDLLPVDPNRAGLRLENKDSSSWGGSVIFRDGFYHMFASEILYNCGLYAWTTNSQVIRAVSESPYGPYRKVQVILPPFAHDANVIEAPSGEIVLFVTALRGVQPRDCREYHRRTNNNTNRAEHERSFSETNSTAPPKDTYMLWAPRPDGPWSEPVLVLNSTIWNSDYWPKNHRIAKCDSNLNGIILDDHSFLGLWRRCETEDLLTIPHTLTASDWKNASTYQPHVEPIFVLAGSGAEDPSNIWTTSTWDIPNAYHAIFHDEQSTRCMLGQCSANGRHAFSLDGKSWRYSSVDAYQRNVSFQDGKTVTVDTRARAHVILNPSTQQPIALSTGLKETDESGYVWTLVQPMRQSQDVLAGAVSQRP